jgi:putative transposase
MEDDKIITLRQPGEVADPLTEVLRNGARALLTQAVEAEVAEALAAYARLTMDDGRRRLVRHGHMPERTIQTGIGPVTVRQPRVRDRGSADGERIRFSSTLLPPYARRAKSLDALLPVLYLWGISRSKRLS